MTTTAPNPRPHRTSRGDGGAASVELTLATPLLGLMLVLLVQFALWEHAVHIAQAAANSGVQSARSYRATADDGRRQTTTVLARLSGTVLADTTVTCDRGATTATVTVSGRAIDVLPGLRLPVRASVTAPLELVGGTP